MVDFFLSFSPTVDFLYLENWVYLVSSTWRDEVFLVFLFDFLTILSSIVAILVKSCVP